jgi:glyoxylase-like metal-dependent hydrolase (beta-lactamase superfamily II)
MQEIEQGIYINNNYPGVTLGALISSQGALLVDAPPHPDDGRSWVSIVRNIGNGPNRLLVTLDDHADRTIGLRAMETSVIAHIETAQSLDNRPAIFKGQNPETGSEWEFCDGLSGIRWAKPNLTFTEQAIIEWGDQTFLLEHHPGPSPGASWLVAPDLGVAFIGDTVTVKQPPFIANADIDVWVDTLDVLLNKHYKNYLLISGRGGVVELGDVREVRCFLKEVQKRLERFSSRQAHPSETANTVDNLLTRFDFPAERHVFYHQRLAHGLFKYYTQHYYPEPEEDEG